MKSIRHITVIGDGGWGTALAVHLARHGHAVTLWGAFENNVKAMKKTRVNKKFLPGVKLPPKVSLEFDLTKAVDKADALLLAVPSQFLGGVLKQIKKTNYQGKSILSVVKGVEPRSLKRMSQLITEELGKISLAILSGPTIAGEVARGVPATAVIASKNAALAKKFQSIFNSPSFRIYSSTDIIGVELGGSMKNVVALACGICDGLGYGTNTKAAIVTRGLAEMSRLGKAMGAKPKTFQGLSGLGDLVTTCFSPQSRNRTVGEKLGKGHSLKAVLSSMDAVAEGVITSKAIYQLGKKYKISMPIIEEVYGIVYQGKKPKNAVSNLMRRQAKAE